MLYFQIVVVIAVFGGIAWVAAGRGGGIADAQPDRPEVALPDTRPLGKPDIDAARFAVGWRGYRMDQVDQVLDRLAAEIETRDRLIAELTAGQAGPGYGTGPAFGEALGHRPGAPAGERGQESPGATLTVDDPDTARFQRGPGHDPGPGTDPGEGGGNPPATWYRPSE